MNSGVAMRSLIGILMLCSPATAGSQQPAQRLPSSRQQAVSGVRRATVTISAVRPDGDASGSGFVITSEGIIATAAHLIRGATAATVRLTTGEAFEVQGIVVIDEARDFALLRIAGFGLPTATLGNSDSVEVGRRLLAFGAPLGLEATVSDGLLSSIRIDQGTRLFQVSIPVSPGSSGGPVATEDGSVVGIVVAGIQGGGAQNLNFALPINYLRGQVPLASSKVPIPLPQMTYQPSGLAGLSASGGGDAVAGAMPVRVNDSVHADFRILDGVQLRTETKGTAGTRTTDMVEYALSRTPQGGPTLERIATEVVWQTSGVFSGRQGGTWYRDNTRVVIELGATSGIQYFWRRTPVSNQMAPGTLTLEVVGGRVVVDSSGIRRTGSVPQGAIPTVLLGAVVASLPDSLPQSIYIWFFNPLPLRAEAVRIDFGKAETMKIPLAREGTNCFLNVSAPEESALDERTKYTTVDVVHMTATLEADRLSWPVLARRPHLRVQDAECVRLP